MIGQQFHNLKVIELAPKQSRRKFYVCLCDCGNTSIVQGTRLRMGATKSCGCRRGKNLIGAQITHGQNGTPTWNTWHTMRQRCLNPNATGYKNYGGRGITVCDRWQHSFENFLADMGERPAGLGIDRIDNNAGYSPENCRWVTPKQNCQNRRTNKQKEVML